MAIVLEESGSVNQTSSLNTSDELLRNSDELKSRSVLGGYEIVLPISGSGDYREALDYAIDTARRYSARLVLMYVTSRSRIPEGFLEYARSEGMKDIEWNYNNLLAEQELGPLGKYAEAEGIEWAPHVFVGNLKEALRLYSGNRKAIVILDPTTDKGRFSSAMKLSTKQIAKLDVPVILV